LGVAAPSGVGRFVPIVRWLPTYDRRWLRFDVIAGATVWGLLVPESIAYAGLAGLPPQAGLYTLLATLAAYAVFGTSRHVVAAATSAAAVLLASSIGGLAGADAARYMADAAGLVIFCGGLFLIAGLLRLGFVAQFLSRLVMEGFVFGLAISVTVSQLPKLFGIEKGSGDTIKQFIHLVTHLGDANGPTLAVGAGALVLLFAVERLAPKIPGGLLALVLGILVSSVFSLSSHGVKIVGHVPSGLPTPGIPSIHSADVILLITAAAGLLLVIFSESLGAADNFATKYGYEIDPNQELIALGVANADSGLLGGLAGGGSLSQSAVNDGAGARSEVSPLVAALLILITVLVLTPLFKNLPEAVLAALIIHAVSHLWKVAEMRLYYHLQRLEFWLALATLLGVITIDVLPGLVIGVGAMLLLVIYHASRPQIGSLGRVPGDPGAYGDIDRHPDYDPIPHVVLLRLEAPLFYANATPVRDRIKRLVGETVPPPQGARHRYRRHRAPRHHQRRNAQRTRPHDAFGGHRRRPRRGPPARGQDGATLRACQTTRRGSDLPHHHRSPRCPRRRVHARGAAAGCPPQRRINGAGDRTGIAVRNRGRAQPGAHHRHGAHALDPEGRLNRPAFLAGWIVGLAAVGTIVLLISSGASASSDGAPATWVSILKIVLGVPLVLLAIKQWRGRPRGDAEPELPAWMKRIDTFTLVESAGMAVLLSAINPKNLLLTVGAAAAIVQTGSSTIIRQLRSLCSYCSAPWASGRPWGSTTRWATTRPRPSASRTTGWPGRTPRSWPSFA
jgi:high affinity sulfate transporter 1